MMAAAPIVFCWTDEGAMRPLSRFARMADAEFVIGEQYRLAAVEERSMVSHGHFFASLHEAWINLPEAEAERFPSAEHLRKWCLIKAGYFDQRSIVSASKAEALRIAAFIKPLDEFAVVTVSEAVVTVYTAKSQSYRAQGKKEFNASKQAVLEIAWGLVGIKAGEAAQHVGRAA